MSNAWGTNFRNSEFEKENTRPTVYICIEQKNREYDEKILLAAELGMQNFRCYIGTHAAIWALLRTKKERSGIYFDKGTQLPETMKWIKSVCEYIVIMDVELGPVVKNIDYMFSPFLDYPHLSRLYPESEKSIDKYLCIGPKIFDHAIEAFGKDREKVVMTGWPRMDLWEGLGSELYSKDIIKIRRKHGKFLLFASNFTSISDPGREDISDIEWEIKSLNFDLFSKTISILKIWDKDPNVPKIIIRPHISEDAQIWKIALGKLKKTFIIHKGDITPWLFASEGLIHRGSTTSIQAELGNKNTYYISEVAENGDDDVSQRISRYIVGTGSSPRFYPSYVNLDADRLKSRKILESVLFFSPSGATQEVVDSLVDLNSVPIEKHRANKLRVSQFNKKAALRALGLVKHELTWKLSLTRLPSQLHNTPWGLGLLRIKKVMKLKSKYQQLNVRLITFNLWEIS